MNSNVEACNSQGRRSGVGKILGNSHVRIKSRPVLGTISQNTIFPLRLIDNKAQVKPTIEIFHDEQARDSPKKMTIKNKGKPMDDKENQTRQSQKMTNTEKSKPIDDKENIRVQLSSIHIDTNDIPSCITEAPLACFQVQDEDMNQSFVSSSDSLENVMEIETQSRVPPIEHNHTVDISTTPEYSQDIYQYLKMKETEDMPKPLYMRKQPHITFNMRTILVDWLVEVAGEYNLCAETLHLTFSYIDRFLSYMSVERSKLQLVGIACMFVASKFEEIFPPHVDEFVYITDDTYTKAQILRMEHLILRVLGFDLSVPTSHQFANHLCQIFQMEEQELHLAMYLLELSFLDGSTFLKFSPSLMAASSVALARHTMGEEAWSEEMADMAGYSIYHLNECVVALQEAFVNADSRTQQATRNKFKSSRYHSVSEISPRNIL